MSSNIERDSNLRRTTPVFSSSKYVESDCSGADREQSDQAKDGAVRNVPATDAKMLIHEAVKKGFSLRCALIDERNRVQLTADDVTWGALVYFSSIAKEITDLLAKVNKQSI